MAAANLNLSSYDVTGAVGSVVVRSFLCDENGQKVTGYYGTNGITMVVQEKISQTDASTGLLTLALEPNANITPANSHYMVIVGDSHFLITKTSSTQTLYQALDASPAALIRSTGAAPSDASYVTLGTAANLSAERVLTAGSNITLTDNGAGSTLVIAATAGSIATDALWDAQGDLAGGTGANTAAKLSVGANDTFLMAASGETTGLKWGNAATARTALDVPSNSEAVLDTLIDAKGDLLAGTAADTIARVPVGTDGYALLAASGQTPGVQWTDLSGTYEALTNKDTDGTLAANSDTKYASQKATKTYADTKIPKSTVTQAGGLILATGSGAVTELAPGTPGQSLVYDNSTNKLVPGVSAYASMFGTKPTAATYQNFDRLGCYVDGIGSAAASAVLRMVAIVLPKGVLVSSISFLSGTTALNTGTNQWFALFDSSRSKLGVTSDDTSTAWGASTLKTLNLAVAHTTTYAGLHYIGFMVKASFVPTLATTDAPNAFLTGLAPILAGTADTGLTNPASCPTTAAAITATNTVPWCYVS